MKAEEYFRGKTCVVTGAASGIGFAISEGLLGMGAIVFLADRDKGTLDSSAGRLRGYAGRVHPVVVDVTDQARVQELLEEAASGEGGLDFLFNNAGIGGTMPIGHASLEHWRRVLDVNLWGVVYGVHAAVAIMRKQGRGHIINTSSVAGLMPIPYQALYCASKYAVVGLSESLRFELAEEGIHFSVVCPGDVATRIYGTPIFGERVDVKPPDSAIPAEEAARIILAGVARKEGIIVLPEPMRQLWVQYCTAPEAGEKLLMDMARQRRAAYAAKGSYY